MADPVTEDLRSRIDALLTAHPDPEAAGGVPFRQAQFDAGLAWVHFPTGAGGLGLANSYQPVAEKLLIEAGVRSARLQNPIGYGNAAPILMGHGSEELKNRLLRPCFTNEEVWCQLMSEPGAGSDVAGLATSAVRDGDEWVVNGQKVWTSFAHVARWGLLVARFDPELPKHEGIVCLIVDMNGPGVEVRPLRMATGKADFNEVFLSDVRVNDRFRVGAPGQGWAVVSSNLAAERASFGHGLVFEDANRPLVQAWRSAPDGQLTRDRALRSYVRTWVARATTQRAQQLDTAGASLHPAIVKIVTTEATKERTEVILGLLGPSGMLYEQGGYDFEQPTTAGMRGDQREHFLRARAGTIEGGTSEVLRNILAERVLGLPREPRPDLGVPWRSTRRS
jgi:alkylation response protein AidB-like acyl-CoA dehydrogenase